MNTAQYNFEPKRVTITSKRQFTIPRRFFQTLGFEREAICTVMGGRLIIEPARNEPSGELDDLILADLIDEGYAGAELLAEFRARRTKIRPAVEAILAEADTAAKGEGEFYRPEDIFGEDK